ncbi:PREDICTED: SH3 domain-binding glutamic acid-rich protein homolog isoform X1 [Wasmannia auropunctata]|uniref:SH3 domain-binding glutamic acid-rich protein homolog isoform X1 n=1 Tax=Wasmannia auropunctata TaxID=64793 RepID=UPI0005F09A21|nr:PREDICTED: SH3 domain-binding glutamic acid-rich protein homolog isoform X1 [Wasmannia auropunctata]
MVVKIYVSGISGNKEVKKRQQRVLMILDSKNVEYEIIDITEPGKELEKEFMQANSNARNNKYPLPPQLFNEDDYCGDYEDFDLANEMDELEKFLKVTPAVSTAEITLDSKSQSEIQENGNTSSREPSADKEADILLSDSLPERTTLESESKALDDSKPAEVDSAAKVIASDEGEHAEDSGDKNEEKSDDQEKEE